jgi:hypothetical protein
LRGRNNAEGIFFIPQSVNQRNQWSNHLSHIHKTSALSSARSASPRFAETVILPHWQLDLVLPPATKEMPASFLDS